MFIRPAPGKAPEPVNGSDPNARYWIEDRVYDRVTISPLGREEILALLEDVKARVLALPTVEVEEVA